MRTLRDTVLVSLQNASHIDSVLDTSSIFASCSMRRYYDPCSCELHVLTALGALEDFTPRRFFSSPVIDLLACALVMLEDYKASEGMAVGDGFQSKDHSRKMLGGAAENQPGSPTQLSVRVVGD